MYRKSKSINIKNLHSFYLFHVLFSQSITNTVHNVCCVSCCFVFTSSLYKTTSSDTCIRLIILYLCLNVLFLEIYLSKHFCFDLNNLISRISDKSTFCNGPINFEIKRFNCTNMQFSEKT
jgi:hypothetical protein